MHFPRFDIQEEDNPLYMAYRRSVWENDAMECAPVRVGRNMLIVPGYNREVDRGGLMTLFTDSRPAFGDGRHPTTVLCLTLLEEFIESLEPRQREGISMLDIGTGTGILAIAASLLGITDILGLDLDPDSIINASELAVLNNAGPVEFRLMDAMHLPLTRPYGLITANLLPGLLRTVIPLTAKLALPGAPVIVSGIGDESIDGMEELMRHSGFTQIRRVTSGWWHAYLLRSC